MVNAKAGRVQKSRDHNPLCKNKHEETPTNDKPSKRPRYHEANELIPQPFSGITSKPGPTKLRSKHSIKNQAELHKKVRHKEHKKKKLERQLTEKKINRQLSRKEMKPKQGSKKLSKEDINLNKMIESYTSKLSAATPTKSKWYDN